MLHCSIVEPDSVEMSASHSWGFVGWMVGLMSLISRITEQVELLEHLGNGRSSGCGIAR